MAGVPDADPGHEPDDLTDLPRLYRDLAVWWPLFSSPIDYAEEAAFFHQTLISAVNHPLRTVLELGSGGGNNASHLKTHFQMTLVDRSPEMLRFSSALNPECEHMQGDMRTVRLGREFDAVFVHDAIMYMTTEDDLWRAIETAFVHCRPGGVTLFCPDHVRENFRPATDHGGHDGKTRAMRSLAWTWDPDPNDTTYFIDFAYVLRDEDGSVHVEHDRHIFGLFPRATWLRLLARAGYRTLVVPLVHTDVELGSSELFVAVRPSGRGESENTKEPER